MSIDLLALGEAAIAVAGLVEVVKRAAKLPSAVEDRALPCLALVLGVLWYGLLLSWQQAPDQRWQTVAVGGLVAGLIASGVWSQVSAIVKGYLAQPPRG